MAGVARSNKHYSGSKYYANFKKRDFRIETYKILNDLIVELNRTGDTGDSFWDNLGDWWNRITKWAHNFKPEQTKDKVKSYYKRILDMNDTEQQEIYIRFRQVWNKDIENSIKTEACIGAIENTIAYVSKVKSAMGENSANSFSDISETLMSQLNGYVKLNKTLLNVTKQTLSDDELVQLLESQYTDGSLILELRKFRDTRVLDELGAGDAFLASLSEREGVIIDKLLGLCIGDDDQTSIDGYIKNQVFKNEYGEYLEELYKEYGLDKYGFDPKTYLRTILCNIGGNDTTINGISDEQILIDLKCKIAENSNYIDNIKEATGIDAKEIEILLKTSNIDSYEIKLAKEQYKKLLSNISDNDSDFLDKVSLAEDTQDSLKTLQKYLKTMQTADNVVSGTDVNVVKELKEDLGLSLLNDNKVIEIIDKYGLDFISELCTDYTESIQTINALIETTEKGSAGYYALLDLRDEYKDGYVDVTAKLADYAYEYTVEEAMKKALKISAAVVSTEGVYSLTTFALDTGLKITGISDASEAALNTCTISNISSDIYDCYENAVTAVRNGDHSAEALNKVRITFEAAKESTLMLLDEEIKYYQAKYDSNSSVIAELLNKKEGLENYELGDDAGEWFENNDLNSLFSNSVQK